jgi:hypothetical protein
LRKKILAYVKGEGFSLNTIIVALKLVARWEVLGLEENFKGIYFGHAFSKACQYATMDEKVYKTLKYVFVKVVQRDLQIQITWPKKSRKSRQKWNKTCFIYSLPPRKLNTLMKTTCIF